MNAIRFCNVLSIINLLLEKTFHRRFISSCGNIGCRGFLQEREARPNVEQQGTSLSVSKQHGRIPDCFQEKAALGGEGYRDPNTRTSGA